jgi:hypothetical protein
MRNAVQVKVAYAKTDMSIADEYGMIHALKAGEGWLADDPLVQARPELFQDSPITRVRTSNGWRHVDDL